MQCSLSAQEQKSVFDSGKQLKKTGTANLTAYRSPKRLLLFDVPEALQEIHRITSTKYVAMRPRVKGGVSRLSVFK